MSALDAILIAVGMLVFTFLAIAAIGLGFGAAVKLFYWVVGEEA